MGTVDIDAIVARLHKLEEENSRLKTLLSKHGISYEESKQEPTPVVSKSENKDQINPNQILPCNNEKCTAFLLVHKKVVPLCIRSYVIDAKQ